jgi:SNF2 family DNA or RNA helicase
MQPKWLIHNNILALNIYPDILYPSATDIVGIEFKNQKYYFQYVLNRPSDDLVNIKFNRFPCRMFLELIMPSFKNKRPEITLQLTLNNISFYIDELPNYDQIIIENYWIPILPERVFEIRSILNSCGIFNLGQISLKQCLELLKTGTEYLKISEGPIQKLSEVVYEEPEDFMFLKEIEKKGFKANLYQYQKTGVSWLKSISSENLGCILADEMGLGKTVQIIALLTLFNDKYKYPSMIVAPATLLENWRREFVKFSSEIKVLVHSGPQRTGFPSTIKKFDVIITSYDLVIRDMGMFNTISWKFVILDEAQAIKNPDTSRALSIKNLSKKIGIAVTGTPVENKLMDLWSLMDFCCNGLLGSKSKFENEYIDNLEGAKKLEKIVSPLILRRKVADVASDLPEKIIIPQVVEMNELSTDLYDQLRQQIIDEYGDAATLVSLIKLRQFCAHPSLLNPEFSNFPEKSSNKYKRLTEILDEIILKNEKTIIFTSFISMADLLVSDLSKRFGVNCSQIDGRTPVENRQKVVDNFSLINGAAILILNPKAAGTGLNITSANHVIHYNLEWNPAIEDQATARSYRRGQLLPVTVHRLFYSNTIEEIVNDRIERKRIIANSAIIGTDTSEIDKSDIARVLKLSPKIN